MYLNNVELLVKHLRYQGKQYENGSMARGGGGNKHLLTYAAEEIEILQRENAELTRKLAAHCAQRQRLQRLLIEMRYDEAIEFFSNKDGQEELTRLLEEAKSKAVPEGWQLVPTHHVETMAEAFYVANPVWFGYGYAAMLSAAPQPPKEQT